MYSRSTSDTYVYIPCIITTTGASFTKIEEWSASFGTCQYTYFKDDTQGRRISAVTLRAGDRVDAAEMFYGGASGGMHGGLGGTANSLTLGSDEFITSVSGRTGGTVDQLWFKTNKGRSVGGGGNGGEPFSSNGGELVQIAGWQGTASLECIQFLWRKWVPLPCK